MSRDTLLVLMIAAGLSGAVGLAGVALAWALRRRSVRWAAVLLAAVAVGGVIAGVLGTARAMFLNSHDLQVVVVVCVVSGLVTASFALWLGERLVGGARSLRDDARRLGEGARPAGTTDGPQEFTAVTDELARSADRLAEAAERERQLESSRRQLVAWVSHDLRTPLAQIRAMTEALEDGMVDDPSRYHAQMRGQVDRMVGMVDDLFELSRIHAGSLELSLQAVDLHDLVSEALAGAVPVAAAHGVRVDGSVDAGVTVGADPGALSRVVGNLVMNAIRHTPADGVVAIHGHAEGGEVELVVTDGCGGIPDDDLPRVFDVGWRGSHARTPESGTESGTGAGLGLAIVKGLVEAHRGSVAVANAVGGCRFVVRLPAG